MVLGIFWNFFVSPKLRIIAIVKIFFQSINMETAVMQEESEGEEEEEEDPGITDVDDPTPIFIKPISSLPGMQLM